MFQNGVLLSRQYAGFQKKVAFVLSVKRAEVNLCTPSTSKSAGTMSFVIEKKGTSLKTARSILKVLSYFDVFNYPLTREEIHFFLEHEMESTQLNSTLRQLLTDKYVFALGEFYSLQENPLLWDRRIKGNQNAEQLLKTAYKISHVLYQFPYVRGIGISGSLSKNFADRNADIDFFIITASNRLWIARTLMHILKKLSYIIGRQHWFCMNYFIDEDHLEIEERNIYTATELITLIPVCGDQTFQQFFWTNNWASEYYLNYSFKNERYLKEHRQSFIKSMIEKIFNTRMGEGLDNLLMKLTTKRWQNKEATQQLTIKGNRMGLRTGKHFCKPNPVFLQHKILKRYADKLHAMDSRIYLEW